jgi:uncharacterized protein YidB (DUF937 family)
MSDLFSQMLEMLTKKSASTTKRAPSHPAGFDTGSLGNIFGSLMGKNGSQMQSIVRKMVAAGLGSIVKSWIARGPNQLITPEQIESAIGHDTLSRLATENGMTTSQLTQLLSEHLPDAVDQLTPEGELKDESGRFIDLTPRGN